MSHLLLAISAVLFGASCLSPALQFRVFSNNSSQYHLKTDRGGELLLLGWLGIFAGELSWLANPLWVAGAVFVLLGRAGLARVLFGSALLLALLTLRLRHKTVPRDEGGVNKGLLHQLQIGFYLWVSSIAVAFVSSLY